MIIGIDEVGRGCWAGPLLAGAVLLKQPIEGLRDSKLLSRMRREQLDERIRASGADCSLGWVSSAEVDRLGLTAAVRLAMERALADLNCSYDEIIIDGNYNFLEHLPRTSAIIKADATVAAVSAASIIAKVARDNFMRQQALIYPGYGFAKHVGYGTAAHRAALAKLGPCKLHRLSYKPIKALLN